MGTVNLMISYMPSIMTKRLKLGFKRSNSLELDSDDRCARVELNRSY